MTSAAGAERAPAARIAAGRRAAAPRPSRTPERPALPRRAARSRGAALRVVAIALGAALVLLLGLPLLSLVLRVSPGELLDRRPGAADPAGAPAEPRHHARRHGHRRRARAAGRLRCSDAADFRGKRALEVLIDLPMVLPPTVAGVALAHRLRPDRPGRPGARPCSASPCPSRRWASIVAQAFVAAPFFVGAARAGFAEVDRKYLDAAATLRARPGTAFLRVLVPLAAPSLLAGAAMGWARALGEFGATITFAGNMPGVTQTMPLAVYLALQSDVEAAIVARRSSCWPSRSPCSSASGWPPRASPACRPCSTRSSVSDRGEFQLDVAFQAEPGTTTVLVGESGAGKTTVLRLVAGLDRLDRGHVTVGAERYADAERRPAPASLAARHRLRAPGLRAVPPPVGLRQRRVRTPRRRHARPPDHARRGRRRSTLVGIRGARPAAAARAVRRAAAARGAGAGPGAPARGLLLLDEPLVFARPADPPRAPGGAPRPARPPALPHAVRHPQPGRGAGAERPDRRARSGARRPGRHARGRCSAIPARRSWRSWSGPICSWAARSRRRVRSRPIRTPEGLVEIMRLPGPAPRT